MSAGLIPMHPDPGSGACRGGSGGPALMAKWSKGLPELVHVKWRRPRRRSAAGCEHVREAAGNRHRQFAAPLAQQGAQWSASAGRVALFTVANVDA